MKVRKKPVVVDAVMWEGSQVSFDAIMDMGLTKWSAGEMGSKSFYILTLEGNMLVTYGDWVIKGTRGEFYPCKPDCFNDTFERIEK